MLSGRTGQAAGREIRMKKSGYRLAALLLALLLSLSALPAAAVSVEAEAPEEQAAAKIGADREPEEQADAAEVTAESTQAPEPETGNARPEQLPDPEEDQGEDPQPSEPSAYDEPSAEDEAPAEEEEGPQAQPAKAPAAPSAAASVEEIVLQRAVIDYDPETQSIVVLSVSSEYVEHLKQYDIGEENEQRIEEAEYAFEVYVNGSSIGSDETYYIVSAEDQSVEERTILGRGGSILCKDETKELAILILDKGADYQIIPCDDSFYYDYWDRYIDLVVDQKEKGYLYPHPADDATREGYSGTAGTGVNEMEFSFLWDLRVFLDIEIIRADDSGHIDFAGNMDITSYVTFKFELRDEEGNISLLPRTFYDNYGGYYGNYITYMEEDGIIQIDITPEDADIDFYGEFDVYIPFGYDYRISVLDYGEEMGCYAYLYDGYNDYDADGFAHQEKNFEKRDDAWAAYMQFTFMPPAETICIGKKTTGDAPEQDFSFELTETIPAYTDAPRDADEWYCPVSNEITQKLSCYHYTLYDAVTGEKIGEGKTDREGVFSLKSNQYAEFRVWALPESFRDYDDDGWWTWRDVYLDQPDMETESRYTVTEGQSGAQSTALLLISKDGTETKLPGPTADAVYGGDRLIITNNYPVETINIDISKVWDDGDDQDGIRPASVSVQLKADGENWGDPVELNTEDGWSYTWEDLPKNQDGKAITYTVEELAVDGYTCVITGDAASGFVLTNTHEVLPEEPDTPDAPDDSEPETAPDTDGTKTASGGHTRREASSQSPKTGDDTNVLFWAALLIGAGLGVTALVYGEQKHKRRR